MKTWRVQCSQCSEWLWWMTITTIAWWGPVWNIVVTQRRAWELLGEGVVQIVKVSGHTLNSRHSYWWAALSYSHYFVVVLALSLLKGLTICRSYLILTRGYILLNFVLQEVLMFNTKLKLDNSIFLIPFHYNFSYEKQPGQVWHHCWLVVDPLPCCLLDPGLQRHSPQPVYCSHVWHFPKSLR